MNVTDPRFEVWLARETGIDAPALGIGALERAVLERVRACRDGASRTASEKKACEKKAGGGDAAAASVADDVVEMYWQLLNASPGERQALVEALVVSETWFFRDRQAFFALARLAGERLVREPARGLRILSAPCSTGEEPYSIAMALFDAGIDVRRFTIDALDISVRAIEQARTAIYGRNSFRGQPLDFRVRHFSASADGWRLNERVRQAVRFAQANLFEPRDADAGYDFIFCRNVLIYFDRDAQDRLIHLLAAQLVEGGTFFVGSAETGLMTQHAMSSVRIPLAFAFRRALPGDMVQRAAMPARLAVDMSGGQASHADVAPRPAPGTVSAAVKHPGSSPGSSAPAFASASTPTPAPAPASTFAPAPAFASAPTPAPVYSCAAPPISVDQVRRLADAGRLDEAEQLAHDFVSAHGPDTGAFYMLGLIADARGSGAAASDYYRKALYLEPGNYEALTHLAALLDMSGDSTGAQHLMRRAQRAATQAEQLNANHLRGLHDTPRR